MLCVFFFFKQKTAYEMRISDLSSDVCSSDLAQLSGLEVEAVKADLEGVARDVAKLFNAVILLKGQESLLAEPSGEIFVHRGGTVGLATGGSGDVLAGIIGGLAAQGASPLKAAAIGRANV